MKKFRVILNVIASIIFGMFAGIAKAFTQNNVLTAMYLEGLQNGNNSVISYMDKLPNIVEVVCILICIVFIVRAVKIIMEKK